MVVSITLLHTLDEMRAAVELQKTFWGDDSESLVPTHMLFSIAKYGGHILAAYDGERMVGLLIGFLGIMQAEEGEDTSASILQFASKRMVVLPEYRSQGIGNRLKLAQRDLALKQGIRLITWTYDPLMALNAHLNVHKLGCICRTYYPDHYGTSPQGGLTLLGSSDRFLAEWWVANRYVEERLTAAGKTASIERLLAKGGHLLNPTSAGQGGYPIPPQTFTLPDLFDGEAVLVEIPADYGHLARQQADLGRSWRAHTRHIFQTLFAGGYRVVDFIHQNYEGRERGFYVLTTVGAEPDEMDGR
ncbi:MAG: GNAT family N-acetyltransferase [Anaerolineae bacterium]|nr:GNAT family N-acetyltransferase [Anaerolineae bacterium]